MLRSQRRDRVRTRVIYTGEPLTVAGRQLAQIGPAETPIPEPTPEQALLETRMMCVWGYTEYVPWKMPIDRTTRRPALPPFGFQFVVPTPDELQVRVHHGLLPQFVDRVLPRIDPDSGEVYGVAGLRPVVHDRYVILARSGMDGRIKILVDRTRWEAAVASALEDSDLRWVPWVAQPKEWTTREAGYNDRYGYLFNYGLDGNALVSGLLRRCHALRNRRTTRFWHLWMDTVVKLEWRGGPTHKVVTGRLLDPEFGLKASMADSEWQCYCDEAEEGKRIGVCYWATIKSHGGLELDLRCAPLRDSLQHG